MPAATSPHSAPRTDPKRSSNPAPSSRKTRTVRRRGRGKDDLESDDEFVREIATDSGSDDDDQSSVDYSTDSDTEIVTEDVLSNGHSRILTPNTTQSSADVPSALKPTKDLDGQRGFFEDSGNWSEMVAEEISRGPAELPVIDFADLTGPTFDQRSLKGPSSRKPVKPSKRPPVKRAVSAPMVDHPAVPPPPPAPASDDQHDEPMTDRPFASTSRQSSQSDVRRGQSARQAYQQRLETDPSYVPTVGEFWGHDDRLLDRDLRSLSGWWRGRRQGRGRGRGAFDRGYMRGRGRGGAFMGPNPGPRGSQSEEDPQDSQTPSTEVPRIDQTWTHDGFEEMRKRDEKRRDAAQQQQAARPTRGSAPRGRGFVLGHGRGGAIRGGGITRSPTRSSTIPATVTISGKIWYAMKPEKVWTKQHEAFLFFDSSLKPRPGIGAGYRVKLSDLEVQIIRGPVQAPKRPAGHSHSPAQASDEGEKNFIVRLPKRTGKEKVLSLPAATGEEPRLEDVFTVRPELAPPRIPVVDNEPTASSSASHRKPSHLDASSSTGLPAEPAESSASSSGASSIASSSPKQSGSQAAEAQPSQLAAGTSDGTLQEHYDTPAPTLLKADTHTPEQQELPGGRRTLPPVPPPLQTVFTPPQLSPPYGSPYGYGSPLPPGIAISQHGMPYEVATGRPVYLPSPIYTPRPLAHGMMTPSGVSYMPGHMHHHPTDSPDFLAPSHTPPHSGFIDPATGSPIFAFPRQSSRVEIRAPALQLDSNSSKSQRRPSSLRTSAAAFEPSRPSSPANEAQSFMSDTVQYPSQDPSGAHSEAIASEQPIDPSMFGYSAYQQPYYYPGQYGYSQYYDMSHMPQYEVYHTDPHASPAGYY
ncbi:hypothetical protein PAXRUDRAFT_826377 [Paxillus rubicundulus Ve08.2h10]|uniref:Unplaced genomic scaffold scaffold_184, whole genome shotgun sequence n=1 Tax=Paxillus rubicundulus Ve08.2h10 TaxID=930991 RepID=A0A0D0E9U3_9AGAM|nr:hypothetical protein PAXRUDRAFT_826377 [Paxillus rubicundulus Ve08.2h10]